MTSQKDYICNQEESKFSPKGRESTKLSPTELTAKTFASLFPYPWKFIYAQSPVGTGKTEWKTETRYPLIAMRLYAHC